MATNQITLTQYSGNISYCRMSTNADPGGVFTQNDTEATSIGGTPFALWADNNDILYIGSSSTFKTVGFKVGTAAVGYGALTAWFSVTSTQYTIGSVTPDHTITIATDVSAKFKDGYQFRISGSTGNDGIYTCNGNATYGAPNTTITVNETLPDGTDDGVIPAHSIWGPLTSSVWFNNTTGFTKDGWLAWTIPGAWGLSSITDSGAYGGAATSGYWIKVTQSEAAPATPATAYHLMRNVTINAPIHVQGPDNEIARQYRDINGTIRNADLTYYGPTRYVIEVTQGCMTMANMNMLAHWEYNRNRVYIEDLARTVANPDFTADAYYTVMQGFINSLPLNFRSPGKMPLERGAYYPIVFGIDTITETSFSRLGGT